MRNVCGRGAGSTVDFIRDKTFFASYIRYRIQEFRQFEEKWLWDFAAENWTQNPKDR